MTTYPIALSFFLLGMIPAISVLAQEEALVDEVDPTEMVIRTFEFPAGEGIIAFRPFDYPKQRKPLGKDQRTNPKRRNIWITGGLLILGVLFFSVLFILRVKSIWLRLGIGISSLLLLLFLAYLFFMLDAYAKMSPPTAVGGAMERLLQLSKALKVEWLDLFTPKDDHYRLGLVRSRAGVIIADYQTNKGWYLPKGQVAAMVAHPDATFEKDAQAEMLFTEESEHTDLPVQTIVFVLKAGNTPSQIWIRHQDDSFKYDGVGMIEEFILAWEQ